MRGLVMCNSTVAALFAFGHVWSEPALLLTRAGNSPGTMIRAKSEALRRCYTALARGCWGISLFKPPTWILQQGGMWRLPP